MCNYLYGQDSYKISPLERGPGFIFPFENLRITISANYYSRVIIFMEKQLDEPSEF